MWPSQEAQEETIRTIPEVDMTAWWEADLREIGAVQGFEEHVLLVPVTPGRRHNAE